MPKMNIREFAAHLNVAESNIRRAIAKGRVIIGEDGKIDAEPQAARYRLTRDDRRVHSGKPKGSPGRKATASTPAAQADAVKEFESGAALERRETELKIALMQAKLDGVLATTLSKEETRRAVAAYFRLIRDKLVNFGNRYGQQVAAAVSADPKVVMAELDKAMRLQLDEIANTKPTLPE